MPSLKARVPNPKDPNKVKPVTIQSWMDMVAFHNNRFWTMDESGLYTVFNGERISLNEFQRRFPIPRPVSFTRSAINPDKRGSFLNA